MRASPAELGLVRDRVGDLEAYAGARLVTLGDGHERGLRVIEFRSGGGLDFDVVVDRSLDIGRLALSGRGISWHSPAGLRPPWLLDRASDRGQGFLRGFSGLLTTCGLDHIRQPETAAVSGNPLHPTGFADYPLHGNGTFQPSRLTGYGLRETEAGAELWCEGEMRQAMAQGDSLMLMRRLVCPAGGRSIAITDEVRNIGAAPSPHMLMYHLNFGYPFLDAGARLVLPAARQVWQNAPHDPFAPLPAPEADQRSELSIHAFASQDAGRCELIAASGARVTVEVDPRQMPYCQLLRMPGRRTYLVAIEPCTSGRRTRAESAAEGELRVLEPGEAVTYQLRLTFSAGPAG